MSNDNRACGTCSRTSENKNRDCPARMSDGRLFTDYRMRCDVNFSKELRQVGKPNDSYNYRQFLIKNADDIMGNIRDAAYKHARCGPCMEPFNTGTMLPEHEKDTCNARTCERNIVGNGWGIGVGRWYGEDSLNNAAFNEFKLKEQAEMSKMQSNCCGEQEQGRGVGAMPRRPMIGGGAPLTGAM